MDSIEREGLHVNWNKRQYFTPEMLHPLYQDIKNGLWEQFCNKIYFADENKGRQLHEDLLMLPQNPHYAYYFKEDEYERIFEYDCYINERAIANLNKH